MHILGGGRGPEQRGKTEAEALSPGFVTFEGVIATLELPPCAALLLCMLQKQLPVSLAWGGF